MRFLIVTPVLCAAACPVAALAQQTEAEAPVPVAGESSDNIDQIVVTAGGLERLDMLASTTVIEDAALERNSDGQIGEVLASLPGVSATSFAPGVSRPVLRGFQGERVRVLSDGVGALDASSTSADHAVAINPLLAERVEVLRGPAVLLFGSSAIGGAVNVIDRRIPTTMPSNGARLDALGGIDSAYDLRELGAAGDARLGGDFVAHLDGSWRETDDLEVPGGRVANSATATWSLGAGLGWITPDANLGFSVSRYDTDYGVPLRPGTDEEVTIGLEQYRVDMRGHVHVSDEGLLHDVVARAGYADYTHTEFEGDEVGTEFAVEGIEGRLELIQNPQNLSDAFELRGSLGLQVAHSDFSAVGAEAFVPPNRTRMLALFVLQELEADMFELELGGRYERSELANDVTGVERQFDTFSGALGLSHTIERDVRLGVNLSRAQRAPSAEELFANGPHVATQQFERGDPDLVAESSWGVEAYAQASFDGAELRAAAYRNWFDNFIYLAATGLEEDELPLFLHAQQDATYTGFEAEASAPLAHVAGGKLLAELGAGYVRARLSDGSAVPRIPPFSLSGALEWQATNLDLRSELEWHARQSRLAVFETPTEGFALVNLSARWRPFADQRLSLLLQLDNAFDAVARRHASFTKDFVPLAGRNVKLTVRVGL